MAVSALINTYHRNTYKTKTKETLKSYEINTWFVALGKGACPQREGKGLCLFGIILLFICGNI